MSLDSNDAITRCIWTEYDVTEGLEVKFTVTGKITQHLGGPLVVPKNKSQLFNHFTASCCFPAKNRRHNIFSDDVFNEVTADDTFHISSKWRHYAELFIMLCVLINIFYKKIQQNTWQEILKHNFTDQTCVDENTKLQSRTDATIIKNKTDIPTSTWGCKQTAPPAGHS